MIDSAWVIVLTSVTLGVFAWVGYRARIDKGSLDDYVTARGSQGNASLGFSFFASGMGAWILFAPPEVGAGVGIIAVLGYALGAATPIAVFGYLGRTLRRKVPSGHSLTEFIRLRFGRAFHSYVVMISILYMLVFVTAELTAIGGIASILSGMSSRFVIVAVAAVTVAYTTYGGLRASIRTDRWQGWLILLLLAIAGIAIFSGVEASGTTAGLLDINRLGIEVAVTLIIAVTAANIFHQGYWQRVWAARDDSSLTRGSLMGAGATIPVVALLGILGIVATGAGIDLGTPPLPFFALIGTLGAWVAAVVLIAGLSLVASSVDTLENALTSLVVAERPRTSFAAARIVTVLLMIPATAVALQGHSVLRLFLIADLLCAATVVPALLSLWDKAASRAVAAGAVAGLIGAVVPGWITEGSPAAGFRLATFPDAIPTLPPFLWALIASLVVSVAGSLVLNERSDGDQLDSRVPALSKG